MTSQASFVGKVALVQTRRLIHMGRVKPRLDPEVAQKLADKEVNPRKLITRRNYGFVKMPALLSIAAQRKIEQVADARFRLEARQLRQVIYKRKIPDEQASLEKKAADIRLELELRDKAKLPYRYDTENAIMPEQFVINNHELQMKIEGKLCSKRRDWHYFDYDEYSSALYMAVRLPANYAGIKTVMNEIKDLLPDYKPRSVLDFGSGMGTTTWAVNATWPNSIREILNVDISRSQQDLNEYLQRGGKERGEPLPGVFHRQYMPVSNRDQYDMVVSGYSLLDLPNAEMRVNLIENLWNKTTNLLVLVERGNRGGFQAISEARHLILDYCGHNVTNRLELSGELKPQIRMTEPGCVVIAPCPHEFLCPRLGMSKKQDHDICRFRIFYEPLDIGQNLEQFSFEEFSYIVLQKGGASSATNPIAAAAGPRWPRVVEKHLKGSSQVTHKLCCPNGHLCSITTTKAKNGNETWKLMKISKWGDIVPIEIDDSNDR